MVVIGEPTPAAEAAQRLASAAMARRCGSVLLADLTRSAVLGPPPSDRSTSGLATLIDVARFASPSLEEVRAAAPATDRGHGLVAGLPHPLDWIAIRPATVAVVLGALRSDAAVVVALVDPDLEGEGATGSIDVEGEHRLVQDRPVRKDNGLVEQGQGRRVAGDGHRQGDPRCSFDGATREPTFSSAREWRGSQQPPARQAARCTSPEQSTPSSVVPPQT